MANFQTTPAAPAATGLKAFNALIANPKTQNYLNEVLSEKKSQFVNNLVALVTNSDTLQFCDPQSIMFAGIKATALNLPLDPNLGFAFIIPYNDKKTGTKKAQFQMGYRGLLQLAIRSGQMQAINVTEVREGEVADENLLTGEIKLKKVANRSDKKIIGYVAYMRLTNGFEKTIYSTREEIEAFALRFSKQTYTDKNGNKNLSSIWNSDFDAMAKKTVLKMLLKFAPLSTELATALSAEETATAQTVDYSVSEPQTAEPETVDFETVDEQPKAVAPAPAEQIPIPQPTPQEILKLNF